LPGGRPGAHRDSLPALGLRDRHQCWHDTAPGGAGVLLPHLAEVGDGVLVLSESAVPSISTSLAISSAESTTPTSNSPPLLETLGRIQGLCHSHLLAAAAGRCEGARECAPDDLLARRREGVVIPRVVVIAVSVAIAASEEVLGALHPAAAPAAALT